MVPLTAAVIVTTPQKLAFIDVAKGVRMFSKLKVSTALQPDMFTRVVYQKTLLSSFFSAGRW